MTRCTKIIILLCSLTAALFHFGTLAVYTFKGRTPEGPAAWQTKYCDPYFHQDWKLFVPPPSANYRLYLPDENGDYHDLLAQLRHAHQSNRLAGRGHVLLSFINYIHVFEKNTLIPGGKIKDDLYFDLLRKAAINYQGQHAIHLPDTTRLMLLVEEKNKRRLYFN